MSEKTGDWIRGEAWTILGFQFDFFVGWNEAPSSDSKTSRVYMVIWKFVGHWNFH